MENLHICKSKNTVKTLTIGNWTNGEHNRNTIKHTYSHTNSW